MRSVSGVVKAMWQLICGCTIFLVRKLKAWVSVARLLLEGFPANGASVQPRRCPGLEPAGRSPSRAQRLAQQNRGRFSAAPRRITLFAAVD